MDPAHVDVIDAPAGPLWILHHHAAVDVADRGGEGVEIVEIARMQLESGNSWFFAEIA